jgi:hypothetical protein
MVARLVSWLGIQPIEIKNQRSRLLVRPNLPTLA